MPTFICTAYPELTLQDAKGVWARFSAGVFETDNVATVKRLRALPESEGISEEPETADGGDPDGSGV